MRALSLIVVLGLMATASPGADSPFKNKNYRAFKNGSTLPLSQRPLQALNVGSTFQITGDIGNLGFTSGLFSSEGRVYGSQREGVPTCFVSPEQDSERVEPAILEKEDRDTCLLKGIEGNQRLTKKVEGGAFTTRLRLSCRGEFPIKISCEKASVGEAQEMTLGEFEKIIAPVFTFGSLALETPLVSGVRNGFPIENPATPKQMLYGELKFKFNDSIPLEFVTAVEPETSAYQLYLQSEVFGIKKTIDRTKGYVHVSLTTPTETRLPANPLLTDVNQIGFSSVESGYYKFRFDRESQMRQSFMLVRGQKLVQGVNTEITVQWTDPESSHITYEGMWSIPGRKTIENWYQF